MDNLFVNGPLILGGLILVFAFSNGFRDSSTIVATVVSTKTMSPRSAFFLSSVFEFCGVLFFGSAVVLTISRGLFGPILSGPKSDLFIVLLSATGAAVLWGGISWWRAWPISNNHAIFGGLVGSSLGIWGPRFFQNFTFTAILLVLFLSPIAGFLLSFVTTEILQRLGEWLTPHVKGVFEKLHLLACMTVSFAHGFNDGQMVISLMVLAFGLARAGGEVGAAPTVIVPFGVRFAVALAISLGVLVGGYRILRKLGMSFYRIRLNQGVGALFSSAGTVLACSLAGFPVSTTQVITGSIVGAGVAKNPRSVRWKIAEEIVVAWCVTLPVVALIAGVAAWLLKEGLVRIK